MKAKLLAMRDEFGGEGVVAYVDGVEVYRSPRFLDAECARDEALAAIIRRVADACALECEQEADRCDRSNAEGAWRCRARILRRVFGASSR